MPRDWKTDLDKFTTFLSQIDVASYSHLRTIKTVEQDLPTGLLPLDIYYRYYWDSTEFKRFDDVFGEYWSTHLKPLNDFIKQYFYGCSYAFVEEGLKARLYRTWMSILTQFHFQYLWNFLFPDQLESNPHLDGMGIDALVLLSGKRVAVQVKKVSYRREVSDRRFTKRQRSYADVMIEVPYLVFDPEELQAKIDNPRTHATTQETCQAALRVFNENFIKLNNGFVIFRHEYLKRVYGTIAQKLGEAGVTTIPYDEILKW
jgi:hypothetical protein